MRYSIFGICFFRNCTRNLLFREKRKLDHESLSSIYLSLYCLNEFLVKLSDCIPLTLLIIKLKLLFGSIRSSSAQITIKLCNTNGNNGNNESIFATILTLFRMDFFGAAHWWGGGGEKPPLPKICHTYPTMIKLGTVIPYPKKIQKIYESRDTQGVLLTSEFFYRKSANFAISRNTDIDCILMHNSYLF